MTKTCILTDSTAQYPVPAFTGRNLIYLISFQVELVGMLKKDDQIRANDFPRTARKGPLPEIITPSAADFERMYVSLGKRYDEIVTIVHSSQLSDTYFNAVKAAKNTEGRTKIVVIDSQSTATGLGLIVQAAAAAAEQGQDAEEIESMIRALLPRVYTVFFIEGLTYLRHKEEYLGEAQAIVAEYMKMLPMFVLDNNQLVPTQKARNLRHMVDLLHEFLCEFEHLEHIALLQGVPPFENETRALRERLTEDFPETSISEHTISPSLAAVIGPRSLGMFVLQSDEL